VLLHAILYQYRLTNLHPAAALEVLSASSQAILAQFQAISFSSRSALDHIFPPEDQWYLSLFHPYPLTIVKWKYAGSVHTSVESVPGLCLTCSCSDKDHILAGLRTMAVIRTKEQGQSTADLACKLVLYSGDINAEDLYDGLLVLTTGIVKGREALLGRAVICFESIKIRVLEVSLA
jgi:hypothetical protein